jgi:DNA-binding NarL/FixJ family response regulator
VYGQSTDLEFVAEATRTIIAEFSGARVIALTTYEGDADIHRALEAGARATYSRERCATR